MKFHKKFVVNTRDTLSDGHSIRNNAEETYAAIADKELAINQAKYRTHLTQKEKKTKRLFLKGNTSEFTHRKSGNQKKRSIQSSRFV